MLQKTETPQLAYAQASIKGVEPNIPQFELLFEVLPLGKDEESCWHPLFSNAVIAKDFPIADRGPETGLEISIPLMAALAGVRHAVEFEGGLLLKGHSSMFVPVKRHGDSVQWHYIENDCEDRLSYWEVENRCPGRVKLNEVNYNSLYNSRAFVGWWPQTETRLGTADVNYDNIDWSATKEVGRSVLFTGGTLGFQQIITGELNFALGPKDGKLHVERKGPYQKIVRCAAKTPVVLYDTDDKRAWLVPASAVILHIAKTRHHREPYLDNDKVVEFPLADTRLSSHDAAEWTLLRSASARISSQENSSKEEYCLRDLVRDIWSLLEVLLDRNVKRERSSKPEVRTTMRYFLQGWEYMDLVEEISPFRQKQTIISKSNGGWTELVHDIDAITLFASGFGNIIRPTEENTGGLCHKWKQMPKEKDYLAVSVPLLNQLFERAGSRLTRKHLTSTHLRWHCNPKLWDKCEHKQSFDCNCDRLQLIVHDSITTFGTISAPGPLEQNGAVVFGQAEHALKLTSELLKPNSKDLYSLPNTGFCMDSIRSPDSNSSSESRTSYSLESSVSTLPTSADGDTDTETEKGKEKGEDHCPNVTPQGTGQREVILSLKRSCPERDALSTTEIGSRRRRK